MKVSHTVPTLSATPNRRSIFRAGVYRPVRMGVLLLKRSTERRRTLSETAKVTEDLVKHPIFPREQLKDANNQAIT